MSHCTPSKPAPRARSSSSRTTGRRRLGVAIASIVMLVVAGLDAAGTARERYTAALAREQAVRARLAAPDASEAVAVEARAVVSAYQGIVRRYPASGYTDNALWQAGRLSIDLFLRFGEPDDKAIAVRLLHLLQEGYPASRLVKGVPDELARLDREARKAARAVESPAASDATAKVATVKAVRRAVLADAVRIVVELDGEVSFHDERLAGPDRVFLDLPAARPAPSLLDRTLRFDGDREPVQQIRVGRQPNSTTRIVLETAGVSSYSIYPLYSPFRLVIDCVRAQAAPVAVLEPLVGRHVTPLLARGLPALRSDSSRAIANALLPVKLPVLSARSIQAPAATLVSSSSQSALLIAEVVSPLKELPAAVPRIAGRKLQPYSPTLPAVGPAAAASLAAAMILAKAAPEPPPLTPTLAPITTAPTTGVLPSPQGQTSSAPTGLPNPTVPDSAKNGTGYSMARQLGLGVSRIVIDPGHGGHDPGAKGKAVDESELVLDIALRVEKLLKSTPGTEIILTRRTDDYIPLQERTALANREGADLFLSIHANASTNIAARGVETYFLNFATTMNAAAVAARENAASGQTMGALPDFVKAIALNNKLDESRDFATEVQQALVERLRGSNKTIKDLGVKQAPFVVLIGAAMPSVLTEISFITNAQEAKLLNSNAYRQRIAEALANAIRKYQSSLRTVRVATK